MKFSLKESTHEDLTTRIFENRNVNIDMKKSFLYPTENDIQPAVAYSNMQRGYDAYSRCMSQGGKIVVLVDSDADGYCSSATFVNYTKLSLGYSNIDVIMHKEKKHGLTKEVMKEVLSMNPDLLVIPDAGSSDFKQHEMLFNAGIEILVIDHHETEKYSEHAIVINNQIQEGVNETLSGGGMVLKFLEYVDSKLDITQSQYYYDLVAVSLVADSMLMTNAETRYYVLEGLDDIYNPFLKMLESKREDRSAFDFISYTVAPAINAIIRVGSEKDKRDLFDAMTCTDRTEIIKLRGQGDVELPLIEYIFKMADRLKSRQTRDVKKILDDTETTILTENLPFTVLVHENQDAQPLSGLIASRLVDRYGKPAIVIRKVEQDNNRVRYDGSGRSTIAFTNFKDYLESTDKFIYCAGHQSAFGVSIDSAQLSSMLSSMLYQSLPDGESCHMVDKAYVDGRVSARDIIEVDELKQYWCKGFEKPKFYIKLTNVCPTSVVTMGKGDTVKITHDYISYIKFKCTQTELDTLLSPQTKDFELIGTFNVNEWNGRSFPQVLIEDYEVKEVENEYDIDFSDFNAFGI